MLYANGTSITQLQHAYKTSRQKIIDMLNLAGIDSPVECILPSQEDEPFEPFPDTLLPSFTEKQLEAMSPEMLRATLSAYANEFGRRAIHAEQRCIDLFNENKRLKDTMLKYVKSRTHRRQKR